jgi:hypothetical protein
MAGRRSKSAASPDASANPGAGLPAAGGSEPSACDIYLSSTWSDLQPELEAIKGFLQGIPMTVRDSKSAHALPTIESCLSDIDSCRVFVIVLGMSYGSVPTNEMGGDGKRSYTEIEFDHAVLRKRGRIFAFLKDSAAKSPIAVNEASMLAALQFRAKVGRVVRASLFKSNVEFLLRLNESRSAIEGALSIKTDQFEVAKIRRQPLGFSRLSSALDDRRREVMSYIEAVFRRPDHSPDPDLVPLQREWSTLLGDDSATYSAVKLLSLLAWALKNGNPDSTRRRSLAPARNNAPAAAERIMKLIFTLAWSPACWDDFKAGDGADKSHEIENGDLLIAGHCAAKGLEFELPHSKAVEQWRYRIDDDLDNLVGSDFRANLFDWAAQQFHNKPRPTLADSAGDATRFAEARKKWEAKVVASLQYQSIKAERQVALLARIPLDRQKQIETLCLHAKQIEALPQACTGTPGNYLLVSELVLLEAIADCQKEIKRLP